jgi:hypothetical protein
MDVLKLTNAMPGIVGKTVERVVLVRRPHWQFQMYLCFTDGTHYEFYGDGSLSGAREVHPGGGVYLGGLLREDALAGRIEVRTVCAPPPSPPATPA